MLQTQSIQMLLVTGVTYVPVRVLFEEITVTPVDFCDKPWSYDSCSSVVYFKDKHLLN